MADDSQSSVVVVSTVPAFGALGRRAADVLRSGYNYGKGLMNFSAVHRNADMKYEASTNYQLNADDSKSDLVVHLKLKDDECGSLDTSCTKEGLLAVEYNVDVNLEEGKANLMAGVDRDLDSSDMRFKGGVKFSNGLFNFGGQINRATDATMSLVGAVVVALQGINLGYQAAYDIDSRALKKTDAAVGFDLNDFNVHLQWNNIPYEYGLTVCHPANSWVTTAIDGIYATDGNNARWTVGLGAKCQLDGDSVLRLKMNKDLQLGSSLEQQISEGVTMTLSMNCDLSNLTGGGHKVGASIEVEA